MGQDGLSEKGVEGMHDEQVVGDLAVEELSPKHPVVVEVEVV